MYYPGNAGYDGQGQWQQPPPPASGPPPPPPPMSAEAAAAYKNYGYGNVAPRSGPNGGRGVRRIVLFEKIQMLDWDTLQLTTSPLLYSCRPQ